MKKTGKYLKLLSKTYRVFEFLADHINGVTRPLDKWKVGWGRRGGGGGGLNSLRETNYLGK